MSDYTLYQGDCLDVMPTLAAGSVALVFADLPYGVTNNHFDDQRTRQRTRSTPAPYRKSEVDLTAFWDAARKVGRPSSAMLMSATQPFASCLVYSNAKMFKYELIWNKVHPTRWLHAKHMPLALHENILCFYAKRPVYNPQVTQRDVAVRHGVRKGRTRNYLEPNRHLCDPNAIYTVRQPVSIVAAKRNQRTSHPNEKPVALLEWLIATYTNPGDLVLDPVFGSNTTGVACARLGRRYIGIEKDPTYFAAGKARLEAEHARLAEQPAQGALAI